MAAPAMRRNDAERRRGASFRAREGTDGQRAAVGGRFRDVLGAAWGATSAAGLVALAQLARGRVEARARQGRAVARIDA